MTVIAKALLLPGKLFSSFFPKRATRVKDRKELMVFTMTGWLLSTVGLPLLVLGGIWFAPPTLEEMRASIQKDDDGRVVSIHLIGTQVTDAGLEHLKGLTSLQRLDLTGTQVTGAGVKMLKQALPNCSIRR